MLTVLIFTIAFILIIITLIIKNNYTLISLYNRYYLKPILKKQQESLTLINKVIAENNILIKELQNAEHKGNTRKQIDRVNNDDIKLMFGENKKDIS